MKQEQPLSNLSARKLLRVLSPCVLGMIFCVVVIIYGLLDMERSGGWSFLGVIIFLPAAFILSVIDFVVKSLIRNRVLLLWLVEVVIIGAGTWYFLRHAYN